jgi:hypothetical protein
MLTIGPNPITSATVLRGEGWTSDRAVEIAIYDLGGRMIATDSAPVIDGRWHIAWSRIPGTARISKGVYLIRATDGEHRAARKVLILR